jgi:hypothetical protein
MLRTSRGSRAHTCSASASSSVETGVDLPERVLDGMVGQGGGDGREGGEFFLGTRRADPVSRSDTTYQDPDGPLIAMDRREGDWSTRAQILATKNRK